MAGVCHPLQRRDEDAGGVAPGWGLLLGGSPNLFWEGGKASQGQAATSCRRKFALPGLGGSAQESLLSETCLTRAACPKQTASVTGHDIDQIRSFGSIWRGRNGYRETPENKRKNKELRLNGKPYQQVLFTHPFKRSKYIPLTFAKSKMGPQFRVIMY